MATVANGLETVTRTVFELTELTEIYVERKRGFRVRLEASLSSNLSAVGL